MNEDNTQAQSKDYGRESAPAETGHTTADPGPIEVGDVMKNFVPRVIDPMEGKDPHLDTRDRGQDSLE